MRKTLASKQGFWEYRAAWLYASGAWIAMRATSLLLVCLLGLGTAANAVAAGAAGAAGSASAGCTGRNSSSEHAGGHDTSSSSGDTMNVSRNGNASSRQPSSSSRSGNSSNSSMDDTPTRFSTGDSAPDGSSHSSSGLGWQSLLPGSIQ
ncbi:hypothetical protein GCM10007898_41960 [Dyella flagellata]|uniref:Uncharacterized protein n=2 Tax=Dyella flagellata TaxID=1867833 RepID=A0ABQ5XFZ7_9GAMM|nr:hypothetical protein GCM10007898_41960 [Dyella flagellata]